MATCQTEVSADGFEIIRLRDSGMNYDHETLLLQGLWVNAHG